MATLQVTVDTESAPGLAAAFGIRAIPSLIEAARPAEPRVAKAGGV
jgi:hypothetical protein